MSYSKLHLRLIFFHFPIPVILMCYCENNCVLLLFSACERFIEFFVCRALQKSINVVEQSERCQNPKSLPLQQAVLAAEENHLTNLFHKQNILFFFLIFFDCYLARVHPLIFLLHIKIKDVYLSFTVSRIRLYQWNLKLINTSISWSLTGHSIHSMYV